MILRHRRNAGRAGKTRRTLRRVAALLVLLALSTWLAPSVVAAEEETTEAWRAERKTSVERWRDATPTQRREMRRAVRERLDRASPRERRRIERIFRRLRELLPDFSPIERMLLVRAVARLPEQERESLRDRLRRIDDLAVPERQALVAELARLIEAQSSEVERLERNRHRWEALSEDDKQEYRAQMQRLRSMSLEERRALLEEMEKRQRSEPPPVAR